MYRAKSIKYPLKFLQPAGTSRGVLHDKESWFVRLWDSEDPETVGIGECSLIPGLSPDSHPGFEQQLKAVCKAVENVVPSYLSSFPAIRFGLETALRDLQQGGKRLLYPSDFTTGATGIPINGLIWMGNKREMLSRIAEKLNQGFSVLKMKVGALSFDDELEIIRALRKKHPPSNLELRLDANGAWQPEEAINKLKQLSKYGIHSVEQPIAAGTPEEMARVCTNSPVPVALDEELIGINNPEQQEQLLTTIKPHYIILKPSLLGGIS
ncbi:MAG: o-succinylbenzoate synthase, partial [Bacteroidales bacterium]|nr:o-succinylbenzoate synthase [Bacteroidales bacterium]